MRYLASQFILVPKKNEKQRIYIDYIDLNKACPKDPLPLPNVDQFVNNSADFAMLSFMDAYSRYNQITMHGPDEEKIAFIIDKGIFNFRMMPFGLKNVGATYQKMMTKIFDGMLGKEVEVYIDDIIAKTDTKGDHIQDLAKIFARLKEHNRRLNPTKCTFGVTKKN